MGAIGGQLCGELRAARSQESGVRSQEARSQEVRRKPPPKLMIPVRRKLIAEC
jgi:hypothetical protein